jgi:hypothetical protein
MLSPYARNLVTTSFGGAVTVTVNVHVSVRFTESVATHATAVVPIGNVDPLPGVQEIVVGGVPAVAVAAG